MCACECLVGGRSAISKRSPHMYVHFRQCAQLRGHHIQRAQQLQQRAGTIEGRELGGGIVLEGRELGGAIVLEERELSGAFFVACSPQ